MMVTLIEQDDRIVIGPPPRAPSDNGESSQSNKMDDDDKVLAAMGYAPVFKREFSMWSCFSFALSISGLYATIMATFSYPLYAGGAASVTWCWLIGGFGAVSLALSIAEITSAYPTSGAMYFTIKYLAPTQHVAIVAWFDGWLCLIGTIAGSASSEYGAAQMLLSAVSIGSSFVYSPTQHHVIGVMAALTVIHALINSLSTAWLNRLSSMYAVLHIGVLVAASIALLVMQRDKHTAEYVFTNIEPVSGWSPPGFSFILGCLSVSWIMTNCDATAHIAEEAKDPARVVPTAIVTASTFAYVAGWLFNIVLAFCMGDPKDLLNSPTGQPVAQLFHDVMGPGAAIFFTAMGFLIMNFVCIPSIQAGSRTIWVFARDEMLPGSSIWYRIWKRTDTPVIAVWLYAVLCILVNLIGLGSHITIAAIFNVCAIALNWSYCIPIICKLLYGQFERGPWHLGRASIFINIWACIWNAFMSVIFLFPTMKPLKSDNMNYAVVILAFVVLFAIVYWFITGRYYYKGPCTRARIVDNIIINDEIAEKVGDQEK